MVDMLYGKVKRKDFPYGELNDRVCVNPKYVAIVMFRGSAKSTITSLFYPLVLAAKGGGPVTGKLSHILILSDTMEGGAKSQYEQMREFIERNKERMQLVFEKWEMKDQTISLYRKGKEPKAKRNMRITFRGVMSGGLRSASRNPVTGERFGLIIADDIISREEDAKSEVIMNKVRSGLYSDAKRAMRGGTKNQLVIINTLYTKTDPIYSSVESGTFMPLVLPICEKIYEGMKKKEFRGAWEENHPYEAVYEEYMVAVTNRTKRIFMQELMCRISDEEDLLVREEEIKWFKRRDKLKDVKLYNWYVTTDFTSSVKPNKNSDYSVAMLWAVDHVGNVYLWDCVIEKLGIEEQYDRMFQMIDRWVRGRLVEIAVENNGNQRAHLVAIKNKMLLEGKSYMLARQKGNRFGAELQGIDSRKMGKTKLDRFKLVAPLIRNGTIQFAEELKRDVYSGEIYGIDELLRELRYTTDEAIKAPHDDAIDGVSQLSAIELVNGDNPTEAEGTKKVKKAGSIGSALFWATKNQYDEEVATGYSSYV
jgi:hypothetical protein